MFYLVDVTRMTELMLLHDRHGFVVPGPFNPGQISSILVHHLVGALRGLRCLPAHPHARVYVYAPAVKHCPPL